MDSGVKISENSRFKFFAENKTMIIFAIKLVIAGGLIYYLASSIEYSKILIAMQNANINMLLAAVLLSVVNIYFQFAKWRLTCGQVLKERAFFCHLRCKALCRSSLGSSKIQFPTKICLFIKICYPFSTFVLYIICLIFTIKVSFLIHL